ncbi:hypothetical protein CESP606_16705 [Cereibacter sphaeroides]|jgi:hypothetical protein|nr:hypothetical protein [Cereibacter sphaeroides]QJC86737.1 hypothetical protein HGN32_21345 [Cereibacter sphaeroides]GEM94669.1 hypothetical protein RSP03_37360 [Cereibacter sphaeroides]
MSRIIPLPPKPAPALHLAAANENPGGATEATIALRSLVTVIARDHAPACA